MKRFLRLFAVIVAVLCFVSNALAQTSSGTISGRVVDQTDAVVVGATVKLINQATNVVVSTTVRQNGNFVFPDVQPGTFTIVIDAKGYKELLQVGLVLAASQSLLLQIGQVTESVTVEATITPLQTTSSERYAVLDNAQLENLLAIGRDSMALTRVLPGVVEPGGSGGYGSSSLGTSGTPTVNGVNSEYNLATIDGVTGNTRGLNTLDTPLNMDAVQQMTLLGSNYQAQYGKTAGGNFNFVTKNGTNQFHGGVYYYFRNEDLNANPFFNKFGNSQPRPRYRYNTIGGTLGGPIYWPGHFNTNKNKLFFFGSVEDSPITSPDGLKNYMVPTQAQINGDFAAGVYASYSIRLKSNIVLYLEQGATILGANTSLTGTTSGYDPAEPNDPWESYQDYGHNHWHNSLLWGEGISNFAIVGTGLIWGKGLSRGGAEKEKPKAETPGAGNKAIALKNCHNVLLRDFSILEGGHFGILATGVDNLTIDNLKIDTNRDGMDIDCCKNVRVSNCSVNSPWVDGICPKSSFALVYPRATENVTITNCYVTGDYLLGTMLDGTYKRWEVGSKIVPTGRIKCGTESNGGLRTLQFRIACLRAAAGLRWSLWMVLCSRTLRLPGSRCGIFGIRLSFCVWGRGCVGRKGFRWGR